jgi:hypothetical protein
MGKRQTFTAEDTTALPDETRRALELYALEMGGVRVSDLLMEYHGSKSALATALSGSTDKKSNAYKSQMRSINRWLAYEAGSKDKQARNPNAKATQEKLRVALAAKRPPPQMNITITGWIGYDDKFYYRTISTQLPNNGATVQQFLEHIRNGNVHAAYDEVFQAYKIGRGIVTVADDKPEIDIDFTGE